MIFTKTSSPHHCQCRKSISVMEVCIKITYRAISEKELQFNVQFDVNFRNIEVINDVKFDVMGN